MFQFMNGQINRSVSDGRKDGLVFYPAHNLTIASSNRAPGTLYFWLLLYYKYTQSRGDPGPPRSVSSTTRSA